MKIKIKDLLASITRFKVFGKFVAGYLPQNSGDAPFVIAEAHTRSYCTVERWGEYVWSIYNGTGISLSDAMTEQIKSGFIKIVSPWVASLETNDRFNVVEDFLNMITRCDDIDTSYSVSLLSDLGALSIDNMDKYERT